MRIVAVLSWFDEEPELLHESVLSWSVLCGSVVALDGAYRGFPRGAPASPLEQRAAIQAACEAAGMDYIVVTPERVWADQPAKRSAAFREAEALAGPSDWYLWVDADEAVASVEADTLNALKTTTLDVAEVVTEIDVGPVLQRRLYRAIPGLRAEDLHYRIVTPGGRLLWNYPGLPCEPAVSVGVRLSHRRNRRSPERLERQQTYYNQRVEHIRD